MAGSEGPLSGVRVVECTHFIAGPLGGRLLADQGADCVKVEPVEGDRYRFSDGCAGDRGDISPDFHMVNRGKRSLALDVKTAPGLEVFRRLLARADVFISNYRPGVLDSWGCGYQAVKALNPRIIYVAVSGYGQTGPYSGIGCFDTAIQALTGMAAFQGEDAASPPRLLQDAVFDKVTAMTIKDAVTAALYARDARGRGGQLVEVSLLEAGQAFFWPHAMKGHTFFAAETRAAIGGHRFRWQVFQDGPNEYREPLCGAPVLQMGEVHENIQTKHNGNLLERPLYSKVVVREPRPPARFAGTPTPDPLPAPGLGEHREGILAELGYGRDEVRSLEERGAFGYAAPYRRRGPERSRL